jgi:hypothetical protein
MPAKATPSYLLFGKDPEKAESAVIFYKHWKKAETEKRYRAKERMERQLG